MIKKTIYIGSPAYLRTEKQQLLIQYPDEDKADVRRAIEDIGVLILDHYQVTISHTLISRLLSNNTAIITTDEKHMPQGLMLNLEGNQVQHERFMHQISASQPLKKNLWQQTVKAKINNQAILLEKQGIPIDKMKLWISKVRVGDPDNFEGRAAAYYWRNLFEKDIDGFTRGRYDAEPNNLLNYGYAILRATVARSLVASGLLPTLGIHHRNKYNAYCLADDIMEPYRPFVDEMVLDIMDEFDDWSILTQEIKAELLTIPAINITIDGKGSPLMVGLRRTTASLFRCFEGSARKILYPTLE